MLCPVPRPRIHLVVKRWFLFPPPREKVLKSLALASFESEFQSKILQILYIFYIFEIQGWAPTLSLWAAPPWSHAV